MTQTAMIITSAAFCLLPVSCVLLLVHAGKVKKLMGSPGCAFNRNVKALHILILVSTPALIALNYFRELEPLTVFAVSGVGVLGFTIGLKDLLYTRMSGIYEKGLIWTAASVLYSDVDTYTRPEAGSLIVLTRDRTEKPIIMKETGTLDRIAAKLDSCAHPLQ